ncbi:MAG: hypothetical protein LKJ86_04615 [Oscillibacter sp.]|nr:hypothetical protein [Oscillibacter sp.]
MAKYCMLTFTPGAGQKFTYDISAKSVQDVQAKAEKGATVMQVYQYNDAGILTKDGIF